VKKLFAVSLVALAAAAQAQTQTAALDGTEEIVVTAQKREEKLSDVPVTVTAYTGARLESLGVTEYDQLSAFVPGLNVQEQSANNPGFVIRGITSDTGSAQQAARVTLYYNGVDVSRSRGAYQDLFDIERVEVVKGPQATLFGTASAIGAVSLLSNKPTPRFGAGFTAGYGNFDRTLLSGFVNTGGDVISARIAAAWKKRDGYIANLAGLPGTVSAAQGLPRRDDLNGQDQFGLRGSVRIAPTDRGRIDIVATWDRQRNSGTSFKSGALPPLGGNLSPNAAAELGGSPVSLAVLGLDQPGLERDVYDVNLTATLDLTDTLTFTTVNGYRKFDSLEVFDADGSGLWYLEFAEDAKGDQLSHESRISLSGNRLRGFVGVNYFAEKGSQRVPFSTEEGILIACTPAFAALQAAIGRPACLLPNGTAPSRNASALFSRGAFTTIPYQSEFSNFGDNTSFSVFADVTFLPTERLELTAGLRYVTEDRKSQYSSIVPNLRIPTLLGIPSFTPFATTTGGARFTAEGSFDAWLPRFNLLFRASDALNLYGTVSKGRRSASLNLDAARVAGVVQPNLNTVPAEIVWNYEGGIKGSAGALSGALSAFYQTYDNFAVSVVEAGRTVTRNAGTATNWGIEAEARAALGEMVSLFANGAYIEAGIDNDPQNGVFAGQRFRLQPKYQAAAGATITAPLGETVELFATPTVTYRSKIFFETPNTQLISEDGVALVNLRAGVRSADARWTVTGTASNLTNRKYIIDAGNTGGGFGYPTFIAAEPRFYGIEVGVKF
jgi:iron complex outermembrane recepter protein